MHGGGTINLKPVNCLVCLRAYEDTAEQASAEVLETVPELAPEPAREPAPASAPAPAGPSQLRFQVGDRVKCQADGSTYDGFVGGVVVRLHWRDETWPASRRPSDLYQIRPDTGPMVSASQDTDIYIRAWLGPDWTKWTSPFLDYSELINKPLVGVVVYTNGRGEMSMNEPDEGYDQKEYHGSLESFEDLVVQATQIDNIVLRFTEGQRVVARVGWWEAPVPFARWETGTVRDTRCPAGAHGDADWCAGDLCYRVELDRPDDIWPSSGQTWLTCDDEDASIRLPSDRLEVDHEELDSSMVTTRDLPIREYGRDCLEHAKRLLRGSYEGAHRDSWWFEAHEAAKVATQWFQGETTKPKKERAEALFVAGKALQEKWGRNEGTNANRDLPSTFDLSQLPQLTAAKLFEQALALDKKHKDAKKCLAILLTQVQKAKAKKAPPQPVTPQCVPREHTKSRKCKKEEQKTTKTPTLADLTASKVAISDSLSDLARQGREKKATEEAEHARAKQRQSKAIAAAAKEEADVKEQRLTQLQKQKEEAAAVSDIVLTGQERMGDIQRLIRELQVDAAPVVDVSEPEATDWVGEMQDAIVPISEVEAAVQQPAGVVSDDLVSQSEPEPEPGEADDEAGMGLEGLLFEFEITREASNQLSRLDKPLMQAAMKRLNAVGSGITSDRLWHPLTENIPKAKPGEPKLELYSTSFMKGYRVLWELTPEYSSLNQERVDRRHPCLVCRKTQRLRGGD